MLKRVRIRPSRNGVKVYGFEHAAKGGDKLVGYFECELGDLKNILKNPEMQEIIGLDKQPKRRTPTRSGNVP